MESKTEVEGQGEGGSGRSLWERTMKLRGRESTHLAGLRVWALPRGWAVPAPPLHGVGARGMGFALKRGPGRLECVACTCDGASSSVGELSSHTNLST